MAIVFPSGLDNFTNPTPANNLNTPTVLHTDQHSDLNDAVEALEAKVGINGSLVTGTLDFRVVQLESGSSHAPVTLGTANGLSLVGQQLSLALSATGTTGALSGADWSTFNNKQNALGFTAVPNTRLINTTSPLAGGGDLSTDRTLSMPQATGTQSGYLSGADWVVFNSKQSSLSFPLAANLGGTGINNSGTFTNQSNSAITGGGVISLGGFTATIPASLTVAGLAIQNVYTVAQMIDVGSDVIPLTLQLHSSHTVSALVIETSTGTDLFAINKIGGITQSVSNDFNSSGFGVLNDIAYILSTSGASWGNNAAALSVATNITTSLNRTVWGVLASVAYSASTGNYDVEIAGGRFSASSQTTGGGSVQSLTGGSFISNSLSNRSGYALNYYGGKFEVLADSNAAKTATRAAGVYVPSITGNGNVTVPNVYGLLIDDQTFGTARYAIQTGIGIVSLLGSKTVASTAGAVWKGIELRAATATITGNTNITNAAGFNYFDIARPTLSAALGVVITNSSTMYIANSPIGAGSGTITNPYSIWVDDGLTRLDGGLAIEGSATKNVFYGTYIPTGTAAANLDSTPTFTEAQYLRVGNTVTVSGRFTADPTLPATTTSFEITLPIASNIGAVEDAAGVAFCGNIAGMGAEVIGVVANDTAKINWVSSDTTSQTWSYTFTYQVI